MERRRTFHSKKCEIFQKSGIMRHYSSRAPFAISLYREKVTDARPDRRELNRMFDKLAPGDVVTVTRIDRLARSTFDLFAIVKRVADAKVQFRSSGGAVGRYRHQHRALDAGGFGRACRCSRRPTTSRNVARRGIYAGCGPWLTKLAATLPPKRRTRATMH